MTDITNQSQQSFIGSCGNPPVLNTALQGATHFLLIGVDLQYRAHLLS